MKIGKNIYFFKCGAIWNVKIFKLHFLKVGYIWKIEKED
jgi:hypothetical protein